MINIMYVVCFVLMITSLSLLWHVRALKRAQRALKDVQASVPYVRYLAIELSNQDAPQWRRYHTLECLMFNIDAIQRSSDSILGVSTTGNHMFEKPSYFGDDVKTRVTKNNIDTMDEE